MVDRRNAAEYLEYVLECLRQRLQEVQEALEAGVKEIEDMHDYYWENYTEMDQYGYEEFDNRQALLQQVNANEDQRRLRRRFRKMLDSPFFGRVDFVYEGDEEPEEFYIGIGNFARQAGGSPLVYDWRAPVSGLFYDYDRGPAKYEAPSGVFKGEILSKWQFKIRRGKMIYGFESDIKIDDEILGAELGGSGETHLKNIIRTIQKEQNAIIRNTADRIMVIQGTAGSGKTSVALHRIAYLLYHDRQNLKSSNILILSPNSVFADYISRILPELGEENIREMSFDLFAYRDLQDTVADCEDKYDLIEKAVLDPSVMERFREKQSGEFISRLDRFMMELEDDLPDFCDVEYHGFRKKESEIINLFYFKFSEIPLLSRMEAVAEYFIDEVETLRQRDLADEEREEILAKFMKMYSTRDCYTLYSRFLKSEGYRPLPKRAPEKRRLSYEDVYPLLYLKYSLNRCHVHSGIRHLVVDEMQDYSRVQYLLLKKMFPCRMTILGDRAQTMEDRQQDVLEFLPRIFGKDIRIIHMNKSYRNTVEIAEYANRIAGITDMELFQRHGAPVQEEEFTSRSEAFAEVLRTWKEDSERLETAAVIFYTEAEAREAADWFDENAGETDGEKRISYLDRNSSTFCKGLTITTFYLAKGLEFDRVYGIFTSGDRNPLHRQARYIAATRALHELKMYKV